MEISELLALKKELREQWRLLWRDRFDDRVKAEGVASNEYPNLFVEKGTVIIASRDYRPLSFHEILEMHLSFPVADIVDPSPSRGGVGKFIREVIMKEAGRRMPSPSPKPKSGKSQQPKKGGRGWLHFKFR